MVNTIKESATRTPQVVKSLQDCLLEIECNVPSHSKVHERQQPSHVKTIAPPCGTTVELFEPMGHPILFLSFFF